MEGSLVSQEVMPVTRDHQVQVNIGYAAKISKQVLRSQLKDRIAKLSQSVKEQREQANEVLDTGKLTSYLNEQVEKSLSSDGDLTRLRRLVNKFMVDDEEHNFPTNASLVKSISARREASRYTAARSDSDAIVRLMEEGHFSVGVDLRLIPDIEGVFTEECGFEAVIPLNDEWKDKIQKHVAMYDEIYRIENEVSDLKDKLANIDELVEEMEAKMLVEELRSSEEGKRVLSISASIIGDALGETPELLSLKETK